jgi:hypothetical protein
LRGRPGGKRAAQLPRRESVAHYMSGRRERGERLMSKYFAKMIVSKIQEQERHMAQSEYFIPFGEYVREDGERVKVEMRGETEKAYKVRVDVVGTRSRVDLFIPKSHPA